MKNSYTYTALTTTGEFTTGKITAASERDAILLLREQGLYPTSVKPSDVKAKDRVTSNIPVPSISPLDIYTFLAGLVFGIATVTVIFKFLD